METKIDVVRIFKQLWGKRKILIIWGAGGLVLGLILAFSIPKTYQSTVKFAPEMKAGQNSMNQLGGIASMMGMDISGNSTAGLTQAIYPDIVKSSPFISEFRDILVPYNGGRITLYKYLLKEQKRAWWNYLSPFYIMTLFSKSDTLQKDVDKFRPTRIQNSFEESFSKSITITQDKKSSIYELKIVMQDPEIAALVADSVYSKLGKYMAEYFTFKTRTELASNEEMLKQAKQAYYDADMAYANTQDRNQSIVSQVAKTKVDRLENEKNLTFTIYQQLAAQVEMLRVRVLEQTPIATIIEPARVPNLPVAPNKKLILLISVFGAILIKSFHITVKTLMAKNETN